MKYDIDSFYKNVKKILEERDIPQKEIYTEIGMQQSNFSNAYNRTGGKKFTLEQMLNIAEYLGCSLDYMFSTGADNEGEKYIRIPKMSEWTCADLLPLLFSLRKSGAKIHLIDTTAPDFPFENETVDVTALIFSKKFSMKAWPSFIGSNADMLINTAMREWAQIIESTNNLDEDSKELMLSTWENKKIDQLRNVVLTDKPIEYVIDEKTKQYVIYERPDEKQSD